MWFFSSIFLRSAVCTFESHNFQTFWYSEPLSLKAEVPAQMFDFYMSLIDGGLEKISKKYVFHLVLIYSETHF